MTGSSSWSEDAPGADILDLDRYMRGTRPARRPQRNISSSGLVVDAGAVGRPASPPGDSSSGSEASEPSEPSGPSGPSDKRFSHDSGLSDTSYRRASRQQRRHRADTVSKNDTEVPRRSNKSGGGAIRRGKSGEARRGNSGEARQAKSGQARRSNSGEARRGKSGEARRGKSGSEARRSSESRSSFRESLERALRDQQSV
ncbi:serine/arginine repetitive matrix protein 2-like [Cydia pomonella]|uniref:serine/arginine repetitive matrix protein 2-like n=1 Tax=Cydia pomonella TaxID=82600 RepID=UPI002ADD41BE|nr:serine/arginine repetitive matrix protein 2-like [Cydia pomonella]